jgi:hypothetical protein
LRSDDRQLDITKRIRAAGNRPAAFQRGYGI